MDNSHRTPAAQHLGCVQRPAPTMSPIGSTFRNLPARRPSRAVPLEAPPRPYRILATMLLIALTGSCVAARARGGETSASGAAGAAGAAPLVLLNHTTSLVEAEVSHTLLATEVKLSEMEVPPRRYERCRCCCRRRRGPRRVVAVHAPCTSMAEYHHQPLSPPPPPSETAGRVRLPDSGADDRRSGLHCLNLLSPLDGRQLRQHQLQD